MGCFGMMIVKYRSHGGSLGAVNWRGGLKQQLLHITGQLGPSLECSFTQQLLHI
jgi:hypothetical protein